MSLSAGCDSIVEAANASSASFTSNNNHDEIEATNSTSNTNLSSFQSSLESQIQHQRELIEVQKKEIEHAKVQQIKAQHDFVSHVMDGIGKLMNEQNNKLITMATKSYEKQQSENEEIAKVVKESEVRSKRKQKHHTTHSYNQQPTARGFIPRRELSPSTARALRRTSERSTASSSTLERTTSSPPMPLPRPLPAFPSSRVSKVRID